MQHGHRGGDARLTSGAASRPRLANGRRRARVLFVATLFVFSVFAAQLIRLQALEASAIAENARDQRMGKKTVLPALRGQFTDAAGRPLAESVDRYTVEACPVQVAKYRKDGAEVGVDGAARELAPVLGIAEADLVVKLTPKDDKDCYRELKKGLEPMQWRKVNELQVAGVWAETTQERTYPGGAAAAPLVGWVGVTGQARQGDGGGGLELVHNDSLTGKPGEMTAEYSVTGQVIPMAERQITPAQPGRGVRLTIDTDLQWYAYNAIAAKVQEQKAQWGEIVVMDRQGRIKAAAQYPSFDPKNIGTKDITGALPFQATFEPGSTAKVMSIGASLDQGVTAPETPYTVPAALPRPQNDITIRDMYPHDTLNLTTTGILAVSSNIGTSLVAEKLSEQTLYDYQRKFGMGSATGVEFPGESEGILVPPEKMSGSQRYTVMYGQGLAVTAVQAAGVFQTVANGGVRIQPTLIAGSTDPDGTFHPAPQPQSTRVLKQDTSRTLLKMMENVTSEGGTAVGAEIPGYRVAGKTGTADIAENGGYAGKNTLSFIGIAPADDPQLICAVILQAPESNSSAIVAPPFKSVMTYALQKFTIPPTGSALDPFPNYWGAQADRNRAR